MYILTLQIVKNFQLDKPHIYLMILPYFPSPLVSIFFSYPRYIQPTSVTFLISL
ncbi:hypothetical protein AB205_0099980 [Aquarana catesbeiana]|uniref:Uncharacterized protein n=1 Tax=Aquarana catesbeiana TaxID=8400 RepID=A0A2G9S172_AQUCT|nr:hypothetical protein AB205_0099980 [Aquarana catesbeiana]PIO33928.1 hypothetical protein AB205_0099980 [Aquarana catesbeiana]